jgi:hypothetical protein
VGQEVNKLEIIAKNISKSFVILLISSVFIFIYFLIENESRFKYQELRGTFDEINNVLNNHKYLEKNFNRFWGINGHKSLEKYLDYLTTVIEKIQNEIIKYETFNGRDSINIPLHDNLIRDSLSFMDCSNTVAALQEFRLMNVYKTRNIIIAAKTSIDQNQMILYQLPAFYLRRLEIDKNLSVNFRNTFMLRDNFSELEEYWSQKYINDKTLIEDNPRNWYLYFPNEDAILDFLKNLDYISIKYGPSTYFFQKNYEANKHILLSSIITMHDYLEKTLNETSAGYKIITPYFEVNINKSGLYILSLLWLSLIFNYLSYQVIVLQKIFTKSDNKETDIFYNSGALGAYLFNNTGKKKITDIYINTQSFLALPILTSIAPICSILITIYNWNNIGLWITSLFFLLITVQIIGLILLLKTLYTIRKNSLRG